MGDDGVKKTVGGEEGSWRVKKGLHAKRPFVETLFQQTIHRGFLHLGV